MKMTRFSSTIALKMVMTWLPNLASRSVTLKSTVSFGNVDSGTCTLKIAPLPMRTGTVRVRCAATAFEWR